MSRRQLRMIFGVLGVLVVAYAGVSLLGRGGPSTGGAPDLGDRIGVDAVLIRTLGPGPGDSVRLEHRAGAWTVNGYRADSSLAHQTIVALDTARAGRLVARSATNHARLGVGTDSTRRVEIGPPDDPALVFLLGGAGADGRYVRFPDSDEVYVVAAPSVRGLVRTVDEWRDRHIAAVDTSSVIRMVVRRGPEETDLRRITTDSTSSWAAEGVAAESAAVAAILESVADLRAIGFPPDSVAQAADFASTVAVLELYDSKDPGSAPVLSLLFLPSPDGSDFMVRRADEPTVYRIGTFTAERMLPERRATLRSGPSSSRNR